MMKGKWMIPFAILLVASVLIYNLWAYGCGHCAVNAFFRIGPPVRISLLILTGVLLFWGWLVLGRFRSTGCRCGRHGFEKHWRFCPDCGDSLQKSS